MNSLKLNRLSDQKLAEREMILLQGGEASTCCCGCYYQDQGGSTTTANAHANYKYGYYSPKCEENGGTFVG